MVIACPNCKRKYQIDTSRIPIGGTSFTCWSCRAVVSVDPVGAAMKSSDDTHDATASPAPETADATGSTTAPSSIPLSAMRFFESLAAEASLNKQMADRSPRTADAEPAPPDSAPSPASTPLQASEPLAAPPEPLASATRTAEIASEPPTPRIASVTIDLLKGDDVLDLPPVVPAVALPADEPGRVLDIDLVPQPTADETPETPETPETLEFAPFDVPPLVPAPSRSGATKFFASEPISPPPPAPEPPAPEPPTPERVAAEPLLEAAKPDLASPPPVPPMPPVRPAPRPRATPAPIPLPVPAEAPAPPPERLDPRVIHTAPTLVVPAPVVPPAEMASPPAAWVAPVVEPPKGRSGRGLLVWALLAVFVVVASVVLILKFYTRGNGTTARTPTAATQKPAPAPAPTPPETAVATQPAPPAPQPSPPPAASAPSGTGVFTIQVRSSPNEADAKAAAAALASAGFDAYVMRADLGARGIWYRVRVGRFGTRDEARQAVAKLHANGRATDAIIEAYEAP
jgi:cell division septation protein DedD